LWFSDWLCDVVCGEFLFWFMGYCFMMMLFHKFRRSIFQQDKSCWTVGVLFWLGYVVSFSDCLWIGCFCLVDMKCLWLVLPGLMCVCWGLWGLGFRVWKMGKSHSNCNMIYIYK
jgi:hypothetical protein